MRKRQYIKIHDNVAILFGKPVMAKKLTPQERLENVKAQLAKAKDEVRRTEAKRDNRYRSIIGTAVLNYAATNEAIKSQIWAAISAHIERDADRQFVAALFENNEHITMSLPSPSPQDYDRANIPYLEEVSDVTHS
jgi:hypothetical protein